MRAPVAACGLVVSLFVRERASREEQMGKLSHEFSDKLREGDQEGRFETTQVLDTGEAPHVAI